MRESDTAYASGGGFPPLHWLPEETSIAPILFEDALYMCDEVTMGRSPDEVFMDIVLRRKDYPYPENKVQSFVLLAGSVAAAGTTDSLCPEHADVLGFEFYLQQLTALKDGDSPHFEGFANCTPEEGCEE